MQYFLTIEQIEARAAIIGLTPPRLCRAARINEGTWSRWRSGKQEPLASKLVAATEALIAAERDVLAALVKQHPDHARACLAGLPSQTEAA